MDSSDSSIIAEVIAGFQSERTNTCIYMAILTLLVYDLLLCIDKEIRYSWRSPKAAARKVPRILYICNRYMPVLSSFLRLGLMAELSDTRYALVFAGRFSAASDSMPLSSCSGFQWFSAVLDVLILLGPAMLTTLRVHALSGRNKTLTSIVLLLSTGPFVVNVCTFYQNVPVNLPQPDPGCTFVVEASATAYISSVIASRTSLILADILAMAVTWWHTRAARKTSTHVLGRPSLEQILWNNGNIYFCTLVSLNTVDMTIIILTVLSQPPQVLNYVLPFVDPMSSILNSRLLLALYETKERLEKGGTSASSFSVDLGGADPGLPAFLTSFTGPCHSAHVHDPELFDSDSESTLRRESEANIDANWETRAVLEEWDLAGEAGDSQCA